MLRLRDHAHASRLYHSALRLSRRSVALQSLIESVWISTNALRDVCSQLRIEGRALGLFQSSFESSPETHFYRLSMRRSNFVSILSSLFSVSTWLWWIASMAGIFVSISPTRLYMADPQNEAPARNEPPRMTYTFFRRCSVTFFA